MARCLGMPVKGQVNGEFERLVGRERVFGDGLYDDGCKTSLFERDQPFGRCIARISALGNHLCDLVGLKSLCTNCHRSSRVKGSWSVRS